MKVYENIKKTSENRLPQRAYYIPYATKAQALLGDRTKSPYYKSLNGTWDFSYHDCDFCEFEHIEKWDKTVVPSCWQANGYGNKMYVNVDYPFPIDVPYVPDENPCGIYRTYFEINENQAKKDVHIVFEGVSSCLFLYINKKYVGFSQGSHFQAEFDISKYINTGTNEILVKVLQFCVGSYLEDQDFFRYSGIFRDVYLLFREKNHIEDIYIKADSKSISVNASTYEIYDGEKKIENLENPVLWNAEKPHLYTVLVYGKEEVIPIKVGMRDIKISNKNELLINGVSVKLKGVNHHDTHPLKGYAMSDGDLKNDLEKMKELNINTIRTSHYPPTPEFLNMCDEMGFYVIDECDIETHGFLRRETDSPYFYDVDKGIWPCDMREFEKEFVERMKRMVERDKNHPCIIMWSTSNESGFGSNHKKMIDFAKTRDKSRLFHAEDLGRKTDFDPLAIEDSYKYTDVFSRMYMSVDYCDEFCTDKKINQPLFLCEYSHAMGNGPGDVHDYIDCMYRHENFIGGCIWEWADHAVLKDGVALYGGDFNEPVHDKNFCVDGLVFCDRSFKAGSLNAKYSYQPFNAFLKNNKIVIENRFDFTDLSERTIIAMLSVDGIVTKKKVLEISLAPHKTTSVDIPFEIPKTCKFGVYIDINMLNGESLEGMCQLDMNSKRERISQSSPSTLTEDEDYIYSSQNGISYKFSKHFGTLVSIQKDNNELIADRVKLTFFRPPTDNERYIKNKWYRFEHISSPTENLNRLCSKIYSCNTEKNKIIVFGSLSGMSRTPILKYKAFYEFFADGSLKITIKGNIKDYPYEFLPRFGFTFVSPEKNDGFSYFGYGDKESYCDMHFHTKMGLYKSCASNEYVNYPMPQEHGNHFNAKMLKMSGGLSFVTDDSFEFNVSEYTAENIASATHTNELKKNGFTNIRIDYKDSGMGSASVGDPLIKKYRFDEKEFEFSFILNK